MVMRNLLRWDLIDMTYLPVNLSSTRRTSRGSIKTRTPFEELPKDVRDPPLCFHLIFAYFVWCLMLSPAGRVTRGGACRFLLVLPVAPEALSCLPSEPLVSRFLSMSSVILAKKGSQGTRERKIACIQSLQYLNVCTSCIRRRHVAPEVVG